MKKTRFFLALILFLALALRFYKLADYPIGFHIDEASLGYNAYSLLETARDENGQFLPLHIDMFGDQRPAGYQYLTILPVALLGLNEFATRLPSALFGVLTVWAVFLLASSIFKERKIGLLAAVITAFSPWHLVISRASAETIVALFFILLGAHLFLSGFEGKKSSFFWALSCWLATLFFYHSSRVFVPLLGLTLTGLLFLKEAKKVKAFKKQLWLVNGLVILVALILVFGVSGGAGRFKQVSIFHFPEIKLVMEEQLREDGVAGVPVLLVRFFHNKLVNYGLGYLKEYFRYFSPNFLFMEGGLPAWYLVPNMGLIYLVELPFILMGLYFCLRKGGLKLIPLFWLLLGPVVAGLTRDDVPNVQRSLVMLPAFILLSAYGFWVAWEGAKKNLKLRWRQLGALVIVAALVCNAAYFFHQYFVHSRLHRPWYRFNGFKEMVLAVEELSPEFDKAVISKTQGGTYMHFLFFAAYDPAVYQQEGSPRDKDFGGFGNYLFVPQECPTQLPEGLVQEGEKVLYVASGVCQEPQFNQEGVRLIKRADGTVVFRITSAIISDEKD